MVLHVKTWAQHMELIFCLPPPPELAWGGESHRVVLGAYSKQCLRIPMRFGDLNRGRQHAREAPFPPTPRDLSR